MSHAPSRDDVVDEGLDRAAHHRVGRVNTVGPVFDVPHLPESCADEQAPSMSMTPGRRQAPVRPRIAWLMVARFAVRDTSVWLPTVAHVSVEEVRGGIVVIHALIPSVFR
jgi:hypothetical protein